MEPEGLLRIDAYAGSTVCEPSRSALMTGRRGGRRSLYSCVASDTNYVRSIKFSGYVGGHHAPRQEPVSGIAAEPLDHAPAKLPNEDSKTNKSTSIVCHSHVRSHGSRKWPATTGSA